MTTTVKTLCEGGYADGYNDDDDDEEEKHDACGSGSGGSRNRGLAPTRAEVENTGVLSHRYAQAGHPCTGLLPPCREYPWTREYPPTFVSTTPRHMQERTDRLVRVSTQPGDKHHKHFTLEFQ